MMKLHILLGLTLVLAVSAQELPPEIELPSGYDWLNMDTLSMVTEEQWFELQAVMKDEHFDQLIGLLGSMPGTDFPLDLTTPMALEDTTFIFLEEEVDGPTTNYWFGGDNSEEADEDLLEEMEEAYEDELEAEEKLEEEGFDDETSEEILEELEDEYYYDEDDSEEEYEYEYEDEDSSGEMVTDLSVLEMIFDLEVDDEMETTAYTDIWEEDYYEATTFSLEDFPNLFDDLADRYNDGVRGSNTAIILFIVLPIVGFLITLIVIIFIVRACRSKRTQANYHKFENAGQLIDEEKKQPV